ncbi:MAG TPA: pectinesterase family protein [Edaphobacter sp.]|jgi:pectinesterase|nr:pectinesterase family protein [Edaphobacter sp.]
MRLVLPLLLAASVCSFAVPSLAQDVHVRVAHGVKTGIEGTAEFPTIQMAMDHHPFAGKDGKPGRVYIEIEPGIYHERVIVTQNHPNITFVGMGKNPEDVVITDSFNAKQAGGTFFTETVRIDAPGFEADNLTFENTAGNTGQAVALAIRSDRAVIKHCRILGHQDTLFADYGRQYYVDTYIEGTVDFIFGNAQAVFDHSHLHELSPGYLTAQSRTSAEQTSGYVIADSRVTADEAALADHHFFLGRPWRPYSRVVYLHTELPATLAPQGWNNWGKVTNEQTTYYAEFGNSGPGANITARAPWSHQLTAAEAKQFLPQNFLRGKDHWDPIAEAKKLP